MPESRIEMTPIFGYSAKGASTSSVGGVGEAPMVLSVFTTLRTLLAHARVTAGGSDNATAATHAATNSLMRAMPTLQGSQLDSDDPLSVYGLDGSVSQRPHISAMGTR